MIKAIMNKKKYISTAIRVREMRSEQKDCLLAGSNGESSGHEEGKSSVICFDEEEETL